jgi:hypothetical protein
MLPPPNVSSATGIPPSPPGCLAAFEHAQTLHEHSHLTTSSSRTSSWTNCAPGCAATNRCSGCGWPSIRARRVFQCAIWVLARKTRRRRSSTPCASSWPPFCFPLFTSAGLNLSFYALTAHFGQWLEGGRRGRKARKSAGGGGAELRSGEEKLPPAPAGAHHARDAPWDRCRAQGRLTGTGLLRTTEHRFSRTGESDGTSWGGSAGTSHLGHREARPTTAGSSAMVASLLSFCASPHIASAGARSAGSREVASWWRPATSS